MRFRYTILLVLVVVLVIGADGARDRSRKKNRDKGKSAETDSAVDDESRRGGFAESESLSEKSRERNRERERERERGMLMGEKEKEEEEESSEEKDDDKKKDATTADPREIVIPEARLRRFKEFDENSEYEWKKSISDNRGGNTQLRKSTELNEGKSIPLEQVQDKRHHIKHRSRRTLREHGEVKELDYGNQEALVKEQKSNHKDKNQAHSKQHRVKRWPQPGKQVHHGRAHKKLRVRDKKKSATVVKHHRAMRVRRAEMAEEQKQEEEKKHQKMDSSSSQSEESHEKKERPVRSLVTRELIPKGYPPNEPQSEETIERDKTLKSLYPFDLF